MRLGDFHEENLGTNSRLARSNINLIRSWVGTEHDLVLIQLDSSNMSEEWWSEQCKVQVLWSL